MNSDDPKGVCSSCSTRGTHGIAFVEIWWQVMNEERVGLWLWYLSYFIFIVCLLKNFIVETKARLLERLIITPQMVLDFSEKLFNYVSLVNTMTQFISKLFYHTPQSMSIVKIHLTTWIPFSSPTQDWLSFCPLFFFFFYRFTN